MKTVKIISFVLTLVVGSTTPSAFCNSPANQTFASPEAAVQAFSLAIAPGKIKELKNLFGSEFINHISYKDPVADEQSLKRLALLMKEKQEIITQPDGSRILELGNQHWPFPARLITSNGKWHFDAESGVQAIIDRRIGENELRAINLASFYGEAQKLYASKDRDGDGFPEYAKRIISSPGSKNGLYWEPAVTGQIREVEPSPFDAVVRTAISEGYQPKGISEVPSYHGYCYKILTSQGASAVGGNKNYISSQGRMTEGFALLVYPVFWGRSGIMSFIVSSDGYIYQKNLGADTVKIAASINAYNPDSSWQQIVE